MTTKPFGTVGKVNAAVVHGKMMLLLGETCLACSARLDRKTSMATLEPRRARHSGCCHPLQIETGSKRHNPHSAPRSNALA